MSNDPREGQNPPAPMPEPDFDPEEGELVVIGAEGRCGCSETLTYRELQPRTLRFS